MKSVCTITALLLSLFVLFASAAISSAKVAVSEHYENSFKKEQNGDLNSAIKEMQEILGVAPKDYTANLRTGWLYYKKGLYIDSIKRYRKALSLAPRAVEPRIGLMLPLIALKRWKKAVSVGREALEFDRDNFTIHSQLAYAYYFWGWYGRAALHYKNALRLYPSNVDMKVGLGWTYLKLGKDKLARELFEQARIVKPRNKLARQGLEILNK